MRKIKKRKIKRHNYYQGNFDKRVQFIKIITFIFFLVIVIKLGYLNIFMNDYYNIQLNKKTDVIISGESAPRGIIYDRNYNVIVDNVSVKKIYYLKPKNVTYLEEIELAYQLIDLLDLTYDNLNLRNLKEFYLIVYEDEGNNKITLEEYQLLKERKLTDNEIYELKIERITEEDLSIFADKDKKCAYLFYLMNKGYAGEEKVIKVKDVTDYEYAYISENIDLFSGFNTKLDWERIYPYGDTLKSILGSVSHGLPVEDVNYYLSLGYDLDDRVGISGIEKQYESILKGEKAKYEVQDDGTLKLISAAKKGNDIVLSIDIKLQKEIEKIIDDELFKTKKESNTKYYNRSFVLIQNPLTGEIYAIAGRQILKNKKNYEIYDYSIGNIVSAVTPGSIVKGASILVGYNTKVIDIGTTLLDSCITFLNVPQKCSWRNMGYVNDLDALKWSSNIYQFKIAMMVGGFNYSPNKYLKLDLNAFDIYRKIFYQFGLGVKTGIDFPVEEDGVRGDSTDSDLLINFAIGQYDTYTPLQLSQYVSTIANGGSRIKTHFLKYVLDNDKNVIYEVPIVVLNKLQTEEKYIDRIRQGFRLCSVSGTCTTYTGNLVPRPAGKSGTSESFVDPGTGIYNHPTISNNFIGYAPYDNPIMSIVVSSPDVQDLASGTYKSDVNYRISRKASNAFFRIYDEFGNLK